MLTRWEFILFNSFVSPSRTPASFGLSNGCMLDSSHQVYAFGRPRFTLLRLCLALLPSSMVYAVESDKENQRITLLIARVNLRTFQVLHLHPSFSDPRHGVV